MKNFYVAALFFVGLNVAQAQVYDTGEYAQMTDVSNTGVAVGNVYNAYQVKWTEGEGSVNIGELTSGDFISGWTNVSSDGKYISGTMTNPANGLDEMGRFNVLTNTWTFLGGLNAVSSPTLSTAWGMSDDGSAVVGLGYVSVSVGHAIKWSQSTGIVDLGSTVTSRSSRANSINSDGTVVVGWQDNEYGDREGVYWKNGVQIALKDENNLPTGEAVVVTPDGNTIAGFTLDNPFVWNVTDGYTKITHPNPDYSGGASGITDDGKTVIGYFRPFGPALLGEGFIYTKETGRVNLNDYVASLGLDDMGMNFSLPLGISPNGKYIVGIGVANDEARGFVIKLPTALGTSAVNTTKVAVYPNPVQNILHLTKADKVSGVEIYNMVGQKILSADKVSKDGLDVSKLTKGAYLLKVKTETQSETIKLLKK
ncbi:T9SS type A sorting domain-containing protein [Kaistella jeonii]|uniref:Secretion system C-terminal sorting domain-containing protein n=1 Tax=Kaistella jeonii TaxID=266749 RepID=A0A0C1F892_9FLAO|nr:T9SS type A sorting domain-containing protein [Kaistella jeonii]KIA89392.1 hypothetical protein OA86_07330 [Kaistella jeonii]SFC04626.1 Por secretion system C-terminal sorting domain-containing protein [Kaistella jeonii]VEI96728.1 Por secretion system C-terminal sorting domain [Kaistella jeonii]